MSEPVTRLEALTTREIEDAIGWANAGGKAIAVEGAATKAAIGRPFAPDLVLSLAKLSGVVSYEPTELVLTAQAGTPLTEIEALLAQHGQRLAFEPMDYAPLFGAPAGRATLGGIIAGNISGPRRIKVGAARDHFLGFAGVSGRGEAFKAGGKVVKNVTGYDLSKLVAGSWGTLAVLTEVTLKVLPTPPETATLLIAGAPDDAAVRALSAALNAPAEVTGAAHLPASVAAGAPVAAVTEGGCAITAIRIEGVGPSMTPSAFAIAGALPGLTLLDPLNAEDSARLWRWVGNVEAFAGDARQVWKLSLPPMAAPGVVEAVRETIDCEVFYDWGGGLIWLACGDDPGAASVIRAAVTRHGGHATLIRAQPLVRGVIDTFHPEPAPLAALSRRVKASFDPKAVLNPGRMWPLAATRA